MPTFTKYKPKTEKELHEIIHREIEELEEGLQVLKYEFASTKGIPDFLCVDSGKRLTIIEVKLGEDRNILFQALGYYSDIDKNRYAISSLFPEKIDPKQNSRIILIAQSFSDDLKWLCTLITPDVELFEYTVITSKSGDKGIVFHPIPLPIDDEPPTQPKGILDLINYNTNQSLREMVEEIRGKIKAIGHGIIEYPTQGYIGYKLKGRQFAYLIVHRKDIVIGSHEIDENMQLLSYEPTRIESNNEDYSEPIERIKKSFQNLGGKVNAVSE